MSKVGSKSKRASKSVRKRGAAKVVSKSSSKSGSSVRDLQRQPVQAVEHDLLDRVRMQWQFGDWESLVAIDVDALERHPDRAILALLIGSAHQQVDDHENARVFVMRARDWGCDKRTMARVLISGVYNTLGRVAAVGNEELRALQHFKSAVDGVSGDARLASQARTVREVARLGLYNQAGSLIKQQLDGVLAPPQIKNALPAASHGSADDAVQKQMQMLAAHCLDETDIHATIDAKLASAEMGPRSSFFFCVALADEFKLRRDNMSAIHFLSTARQFIDKSDQTVVALLSKKLMALGRNAEAMDLLVGSAVGNASFDNREQAVLNEAYAKVREQSVRAIQHGHGVLLEYLNANLQDLKQQAGNRRLVLIEVGSTRENVPGQGSTRIIADYCLYAGIDFITVDMDPHNTSAAASMFEGLGADFRAVNQKGEDFLRDYGGDMDIVFLDAYDFDHGKHSELRQSRYRKFLGSDIDEIECHRMHLDCAQSVHQKLSPSGLVCIDDTWLDDGKWCAKGTLAMPYLLANGFELIDNKHRAALLRRKTRTS